MKWLLCFAQQFMYDKNIFGENIKNITMKLRKIIQFNV